MLNANDEEFIKTVRRNQKLLITCGFTVLFLSISCIYTGNGLFDKAGYISATQQAHDKIAQMETNTALEFRLRETALSNLEFEISQYRLIKVILVSLISFSFFIVSLGCFIFVVVNQKFLRIFKKIACDNNLQ